MRAIELTVAAALLGLAIGCGGGHHDHDHGKIIICATSTDAASLARTIGGGRVDVSTLVAGDQDMHDLELKPSHMTLANKAALLIAVGQGAEHGWLADLIEGAKNPKIAPGTAGYLDLSAPSAAVAPPKHDHDHDGGSDDADGEGSAKGKKHSHHPGENPHYLLDPLEGLKAASAIRDRLKTLDPEHAKGYDTNFEAFEGALAIGLVGPHAVKAHGAEKILAAIGSDTLDTLLGQSQPAGWIGAARSIGDAPLVGDHDLWPAFAKRFGLKIAAYLEPEPGVAPSAKHLAEVSALMKQQKVTRILTSVFFDAKHAKKVADDTGARLLPMAHQVGSRPGTADYLALFEYNLRVLTGQSK